MNKFINFKKLIFSLFILSLSFSTVFLMEDETGGYEPMEQVEQEQSTDKTQKNRKHSRETKLSKQKKFRLDQYIEIEEEDDDSEENDTREVTTENTLFLGLSLDHNLTNGKLRDIIIQSPNLQSLNLKLCNKISDDGMLHVAEYCHELTHLNLSYCRQITETGLRYLTFGCPKLESLAFPRTTTIMGLSIISLKYGPFLKNLSFEDCPLLGEYSLVLNLSRCPNLKTIQIAADLPTDNVLQCIADTCKDFEKLCLVNCNRVTDNGIYALINGCPRLKELHIDNCKQLTVNILYNIVNSDNIVNRDHNDLSIFVKSCPFMDISDIEFFRENYPNTNIKIYTEF